jgi:two-component system, NarL family, response regulator NreC
MALHLRLTGSPAPSGSRPSIRVMLADDHPAVLHCLRVVLDQEEGVEVVAEASDPTTIARGLRAHHPHVLVLDLGIYRGAVIRTIRGLRAGAPNTTIVAVTLSDSRAIARGALNAGALGFVLKDLADSDLPDAVRAAARGEEYVSPRVARRKIELRAR